MSSNIWANLCDKCKHKSCCNDYVTPFLSPKEFLSIQKLGKGNFAKKIKINNISGYELDKKEGSDQCVFWDTEKGCTVYSERPFDCKVFPFDIYKIDGKYTWIVYSCNQDTDWTWSEKILETMERDLFTDDVIKHLEAFTDLGRLEKSDKSYEYKILRQVRLPSNI
ncbi:MAG: YkgJ family cysteine cluster protein [Nitrosopumilus sp.]|uniref:YkgJ family cysteine cluster protein n=1 Tax=Nitrosopumilus sp. TaxID=2024843 RepID=UPI00247E331E|nr:YkgJ family cysteine cluster protein [Nitrosopumilus sp.]MCV0393055.1 YkgJ family cysteine cluster protein [Nitrosopumilus sp.]